MAKKVTTREPAVRIIRYKCEAGTCKATPRTIHMSPGDVIVLIAVNRDVTVDFTNPNSSPFQSGTDPITIAQGTAHPEIVDTQAGGTFEYTYSCKNPLCRTPAAPPKMIVP